MWNTSETTEHHCLQINCNGHNYNFDNLSGLALVDKIKSIARENMINKYDVYDSSNTNISPDDIEAGDFKAPLTIIRFNQAAA